MAFSAPADRWRSLLADPRNYWLRPGRHWAGGAALVALAFLLARAPLTWAASGLVVAGFSIASLLEPMLPLVALALAIPFGNLVSLPLPAGVNTVDLLVVIAILAWLARVARRAIRFLPPPLTWPVLLLAWALALSLSQAQSWRVGLPEWLKWAEFAVLYLMTAQLVGQDHRRAGWVLAALFLAGIVEVGQGAYQFLRQVGPKEFILMGRFMRAYGAFDQPNPFAGYLGYLAPVAASLALGGLGRWWQGRLLPSDRIAASRHRLLAPSTPGSPASRGATHLLVGLTCAVVTLLLAAGIIMSWSRGGWLGLAIALIVVATLRSRRSAPIFAAALIGLAVLILGFGTSWLPAPIAQRFADLDIYSANVDLSRVEVTDANFAVLERLGHWQAGADMFGDHPWLGVGIGNYPVAYPAYARPHFYEPLGHAHNVYVNFLAETGVVGAGAFAAFWLAATWLAWRTARRNSGYSAALAVGVLGTLAYLTVHNLFDNLFVAHTQLQLALLLALMTPWRGDGAT